MVTATRSPLSLAPLLRPTVTTAVALALVAILADLHLALAARTIEEAIGFVDGSSASAFLDLDRTIDDTRSIAVSPPRWCCDCSARGPRLLPGPAIPYRWISRSCPYPVVGTKIAATSARTASEFGQAGARTSRRTRRTRPTSRASSRRATDVIRKLELGWPMSRLSELTPRCWAAQQGLEQRPQ